ncbi:MAG: fatty acid desaturase [Cyanobacteria bacterium]|nr:fatty acid desaturase [Cyanobacteriota bacterium]
MSLFLTVLIVSYLYHGLGITLGYHRLLSHRSFKVPLWLEYLLVSGGYLAFEGSPIFWVTTHRMHHRYSDHPGDPHSPEDGWWHSFIGWMLKPTVSYSDEESRKYCPDLFRDPVYKALHCNHSRYHALLCLVLCCVFRVAIFLLLGPWAVLANLIGALLPFTGALLVNSVGHTPSFGYQTFNTGEKSTNVWWVAMLSLGEGWHNNHHAIPQSARHGMQPLEFDLSWEALKLLRRLTLASEIRLPSSIQMAKKQKLDSVQKV